MSDDIRRLRTEVDELRNRFVPETEQAVAKLAARLEVLEQAVQVIPEGEQPLPVPADQMLGSFGAALSSARTQLLAESSQGAAFVIGAVKADVAAQLAVDGDGKLVMYLPGPGASVQEGALTRLSFSVYPIAEGETDSRHEVLVPIVTGQPLELAKRQVAAAGLKVGDVDHEESDRPDNTVVGQRPGGGATMLTGEAVALVVARSRSVAVPDLIGMAEPEAIEAVASRDLRRRVQRRAVEGVPAGIVVAQAPAAGEFVDRRTQVRLTIAAEERTSR